jgi:hypothetical protein
LFVGQNPMTTNHSSPAMSVILITPDCYETIDLTMTHLLAQSVRDQLEIVIVAPSEDGLEADESVLATFHSFQVVEAGEIKTVGEANAAGARQASAPVIALVEEHSYPHPGWAEALIEAHRQPWAAVGPVVDNAPGDSLVGWADFLVGYGPWLDPSRAGVRDFLPGHNSSYKLALLLEYGPELEGMLESETTLHSSLRQKGHQLYLEPGARISHLNYEKLSVWTRAQYYAGRAFAAQRSEHWSLARRSLYVLAGPLIPFVRLRRILDQVRGSRRPGAPPIAVWPVLLLGLGISATGETIGYTWGAGNAVERRCDLEFHRIRHLHKGGSRPSPGARPQAAP